MSKPDWLRTFVAVFRSGSITEGARVRSLSQPAASQQVAALERAAGGPLFARVPGGVVPTELGRMLYADTASALDQLESVFSWLDAGRAPDATSPLRFGSSAEYFSAEVLSRVAGDDLPLVAWFGSDDALVERLERGELDAAVTSRAPSRRSLSTLTLGEKRFVLVTSAEGLDDHPIGSLDEVATWLADRPWVAYSLELPITRRFWQAQLRRPFPAHALRLVAPDLRAVAGAVERGMGCSLLPWFVCADLLAQGRMAEVYPVADLVPPEPWFLSYRPGDAARASLTRLLALLGAVAPV